MPLTKEQIQAISIMMGEYIAQHRPPEEVRKKLDIGWRLEDRSIYLYEIRPGLEIPGMPEHFDFAKATWIKGEKHWKVFWMRANGKWNVYQPLLNVGNLQRFLIEIEKDPHHCFRG